MSKVFLLSNIFDLRYLGEDMACAHRRASIGSGHSTLSSNFLSFLSPVVDFDPVGSSLHDTSVG